MSRPPQTTVLFDNFPSDWVVGIDLKFFNTNSVFKGIKNIPDGIHIVHFAPDQNSVRCGFYVRARDQEVIILSWDSLNEKMLIGDEIGELNVSKEVGKLPEYYSYMVNYPDNDDDHQWKSLIEYVNWGKLDYILPKNRYIDSLLTSTEENNMLLDALAKSAEKRTTNLSKDPIVNSIIDQSDEEIKYSLIDLKKSLRPNSTPQEKTKDSLDKSWFLNHLLTSQYNSNSELLLGELQLSFINTVIFANYSSSTHWIKIISTLLSCQEIVPSMEPLFSIFLNLLIAQFKILPEEYMDQFIEREVLRKWISEFDYNMKELNLHKLVNKVISLKGVVSERFGILIQGLVEDDEDLPVVVEL